MLRNVSRLLLAPVALAAATMLASCGEAGPPEANRRVLVVGMDGLDPKLLAELLEAGKLPNMLELSREGCLARLGTSTPPQSPVAWSNFITGNDASVHGIFDFVHRDPETMMPYLSTGGFEEGLLRLGTPFWRYLVEHRIQTTIFRMPANYPPDDPGSRYYRCLSGMGTPDLLGNYGTFSLFTEKTTRARKNVSGGAICRLKRRGDKAVGTLTGPPNPNYEEEKKTATRRSRAKTNLEIPFEIQRDPENKVARIAIQDDELVMNVGEWSDWCRVAFTWPQKFAGFHLIDGKISGIVRFMLLQTRPTIELYASPVNFDPDNPPKGQPISVPNDYAAEIAAETGLFYTQGIPEDHAALSEEALTDDQYLIQAQTVMDERIKQFDFALKRFDRGFLFFYFGGSDQVAHMFWRDLDSRHPTFTKALQNKYGQVIGNIYKQLDDALGRARKVLDENDTLIIMSDHGFGSFRRGFNLNTWLKDNGYIAFANEQAFDPDEELFLNVDWDNTQAYGLGINLLYVNLRGRERDGSVPPEQYDSLLNELKRKLEAVRDPETDERVIAEVYRVDEICKGAHEHPEIKKRAPDLIVGYAAGFRASWKTILGAMPSDLVEDNTNRWSGDHCVATHLVPGVILANKPLKNKNPTLLDLAPTILKEFGIDTPKMMKGRPIF